MADPLHGDAQAREVGAVEAEFDSRSEAAKKPYAVT